MKRPTEVEFYSNLEEKISHHLDNGSLVFHGFLDNIQEFYKGVDCVISVSDDESFHLTLIDGPQFGAAAYTLNWLGSEKIYPREMICESVEEMSSSIFTRHQESSMFNFSRHQNNFFMQKYQLEKVALLILSSFNN